MSKKDKKKDKADQGPGSAKGIETMFRNACRSELDLIALAATKANIMISLNGLIISALIISGAFIFASSPQFLLPAVVFLITAAISIIFALLAASPERFGLFTALWKWMRAVLSRKARLNELSEYLNRESEGGDPSRVNPLIADHRAHLSEEDYWDRMRQVMDSRDETYRAMSLQIYWLGEMGNRKLRLLDISYSVFRWGLFLTVLVFIGAWAVMSLMPRIENELGPRGGHFGIAELDNIYEPSAVQQLTDGRILVVEDEAKRAVSLLTITPDGRIESNGVRDQRLLRSFGRKLNDLEGLSIDSEGQIYATTSHSTDNNGNRKEAREQLIRFTIERDQARGVVVYGSLRNALENARDLQASIEEIAGQPADFTKLNVEGLAYVQETGELLLGLRKPAVAGRSLVVSITNPSEVFDDGAEPEFGPPSLLNMQGGGIRALSYDPVLETFLLVNEIDQPEGGRVSQLWSWTGDRESEPLPLSLPDIINLNNVEAIDSVTVGDEPWLLLMSDEGSRKKKRPARYLLLSYDQVGD